MSNPAIALLAETLASYHRDPLGFVCDMYTWGQGELRDHKGPRAWQREELDNLGKRLRAGGTIAHRLAIVSGNGVGKSALGAWLIHWALSTMPDTRVVVTANTGKQLENKTWPELLKWHRRSVNRRQFTPTATALASSDPKHERTWRADAVPWSQTNLEAFAGLHNVGARILLFFDEASGIDDLVWDTAEGALTDEGTEILWLALGNYTRNVGRFHEALQKHRQLWHARAIDSRTVEGVNQAQVAQWKETYGEDSDFFRMRVSALCPTHGVEQFISSTAVAAAAERPRRVLPTDPVVMGVDVARFGQDESVLCIRRGRDARTVPLQCFKTHTDTMQLVGQIVAWVNRCGGMLENIFVDMTGVGGGVVDRLTELGYRVMGVHNQSVSDTPTQEICARKDGEMWCRMREWLKEGAIQDDADLRNQLANRQYYYDSHGRIMLESKDDMRERGVSSPDRADALALTFAYPIAARTSPEAIRMQHVGGGTMESEYDPMARRV